MIFFIITHGKGYKNWKLNVQNAIHEYWHSSLRGWLAKPSQEATKTLHKSTADKNVWWYSFWNGLFWKQKLCSQVRDTTNVKIKILDIKL